MVSIQFNPHGVDEAGAVHLPTHRLHRLSHLRAERRGAHRSHREFVVTIARAAYSRGRCYTPPMTLTFRGTIWFWKGPAPWYFVTIPREECEELQAISRFVTYGWGVIPVTVHIGARTWQTSLFPKDGRYLVPLKARVRDAEQLDEGDDVLVRLDVRVGRDYGRAEQAP